MQYEKPLEEIVNAIDRLATVQEILTGNCFITMSFLKKISHLPVKFLRLDEQINGVMEDRDVMYVENPMHLFDKLIQVKENL